MFSLKSFYCIFTSMFRVSVLLECEPLPQSHVFWSILKNSFSKFPCNPPSFHQLWGACQSLWTKSIRPQVGMLCFCSWCTVTYQTLKAHDILYLNPALKFKLTCPICSFYLDDAVCHSFSVTNISVLYRSAAFLLLNLIWLLKAIYWTRFY